MWIVDLKEKVIEVHEKPEGEAYTVKKTYGIAEVLTSNHVAQLSVSRVIRK